MNIRRKVSTRFWLCFFLLLGSLLFSTAAFAANKKDVVIAVNGKVVDFDVKPYIDQQNRTIVPIRFIGERLNYSFTWDGSKKEITVTGNGSTIKLWIGRKEATVNGKSVTMDTVAVLEQGRAMVPLRFIVENMGATVSYDPKTNVVNVLKSSGTIDFGGSGQESVEVIKGKVAIISASVVNVRSGPSTDYPVLTKANYGTTLEVTGRFGDWYRVAINNQTGWVAGWLVNLKDISSSSRSEEPGERREEPEPDTGILNTILDFQIDPNQEEVIFTVEGENKLSYASFRLDNPSRLVLDFPSSVLKDPNSVKTFNLEHSLVKSVRIAQFQTDQVRVVFDLAGAAGLTLQAEKGGGRILQFKVSKPSIKGKTIVLDPGHGQIKNGVSDPGAIGPNNLKERDVNLDIALRTAAILNEKGANVILTRTGDTELTLTDRAAVANDNNADIFVSIHCNANTNPSARGTSTYYYPSASGQAEARKKLASAVQTELVKAIGLKNLGILQANFVVLRYTNMPSILVETAFISNPEEEKLLADSNFRQKVAEGIARGIEVYFSE